MGSLASRPKVPQVRTVVVQQPVPQSQTPVKTATPSVDQPARTDDQIASDVRTDDLLRRSRGRSGTILTSFRGLQGASEQADGRKTLLGE